jgi:hypothetical protein
LTVTLPGVRSTTLIFGSIVVPAEEERALLSRLLREFWLGNN